MKVKSYNQLRKEFEKKVKELQKKCPHKKISDWIWSFHDRAYTGYKIKFCDFCGKTLKKRKKDLSKFYEEFKIKNI